MILSVSLGIHIISPSLINCTWTSGILPLSHISNHSFFFCFNTKSRASQCIYTRIRQFSSLNIYVQRSDLDSYVKDIFTTSTFFFLNVHFISTLPTIYKECLIFTNKYPTFCYLCVLYDSMGARGPLVIPPQAYCLFITVICTARCLQRAHTRLHPYLRDVHICVHIIFSICRLQFILYLRRSTLKSNWCKALCVAVFLSFFRLCIWKIWKYL